MTLFYTDFCPVESGTDQIIGIRYLGLSRIGTNQNID